MPWDPHRSHLAWRSTDPIWLGAPYDVLQGLSGWSHTSRPMDTLLAMVSKAPDIVRHHQHLVEFVRLFTECLALGTPESFCSA